MKSLKLHFNKGFYPLWGAFIFLFISQALFGQTKLERKVITENYDERKIEEIIMRYSRSSLENKKAAIKRAREEGWIIRKDLKDGRTIELMGLTKNGRPIYYVTENINAARTLSTDDVWVGGSSGYDLNGEDMTLSLWDGGGVLTTHQEFVDQGVSRVIQKDNPGATHYHSTHVAGTIIAAGIVPEAKGMAYSGKIEAYDWNVDYAEMIDAASNGALISNHSYGYLAGWYWNGSEWVWAGDESISTEEDYGFGFYGEIAALWDSISYQFPYFQIVKSAGNDRGDGEGETEHPPDGGDNGYDCISWYANAKNILTVAAVEDLTTGYTGDPSEVVMSSFSSWGPTDDGRIKPDISGNGVEVYSTYNTDDDSYVSLNGTSMASPNVSGSMLLLQQLWNQTQGLFMKASTLKGLVIHTADEAGPAAGPDYMFGWGLMNTKSAADVISNRNLYSLMNEATLENDDTYTMDVEATGGEPLEVTICWTDPPGTPVEASLDPPDKMLVNDLDLRVNKGNEVYEPYKLDLQNPSNAATNGDNDVDNVEKIVINSAEDTIYNIVVDHKGNLTDNQQDFAIIVTGITTGLAQVQTDSVYNVAQETAEVDATVIDEGNESVTERGVVYSTVQSPTIDDSVITSGSGTGSYTCSLTGLDVATSYFVRAYAKSSVGTNYGKVFTFTTDDYLPIVITDSAYDISQHSARVDARITDDKGYPVTERGVVYSTSPEPTIADSVVESGSGIGTFSVFFSSLDMGKTYYCRAYGINSQGVAYGNEIIFNTLCGVFTGLPYKQEFLKGFLPNCWKNIDYVGEGGFWLFNNPGDRDVNTSTASNGFAILDSDYYGYYSSQNADLISPLFDFTDEDSIIIKFEHYYEDWDSETASFHYSIDSGNTWVNIQYWSGADTENPDTFEVNLSDEVAGEKNVLFKWNYTGSYGWYWVVDDIEITGVTLNLTVSIEAIPGCGDGSVRVTSNLSENQTFYLCDSLGAILDSWTGNSAYHEFTGLSNGVYKGQVERDGLVSELSDSVVLVNDSYPVPPTEISGQPDTICKGDTVQLTYTGGSGNEFRWYIDSCEGTFVDTGSNLSVNPAVTTTYYGRWENACGSSDCDSAVINVKPDPIAPDNLVVSKTNICAGQSVSLQYSGGEGDMFRWYADSCGGTSIGTGNNLSVTPSTATTYYGRWENACSNSECESLTVAIMPSTAINEQPVGSTINEGENVTFSVTAEGVNLSYQWRKDHLDLVAGDRYTGIDSSNFTIINTTSEDAGDYDVVVTGDCGIDTSEKATLAITTGINYLSDREIIVYPNPTTGDIFLAGKFLTGAEVKITDVTGRIVFNKKVTKDRIEINLKDYGKSVYFISIEKGGQSFIEKVILD